MKHMGSYHSFYAGVTCTDLEDMDGDVFGFTVIKGYQVPCFESGGEKLLCFPKVLEIIKNISISTIESTASKLGLFLIESSPLKICILHQYNILPQTINHCSLMSQSNCERLLKSLNVSEIPKEQSYFLNTNPRHIIPSKHQHCIRVIHDCFGQQKGILFPQFYVETDSKCIECFDCGEILSPFDFVGHAHNSGDDHEVSLCHWGFKSSNWRWYLRLAEDPSRSEEEEISLNEYLDEIKSRYIKSIEDHLIVSGDQDRQTPMDNESLNTSPSLPTPPSLSPPLGFNINFYQQGSIFQQCIMKIYNTPLANNEDRIQILNFLMMMREEHLNQISMLISDRQTISKSFMKNTQLQTKSECYNFNLYNNTEDKSHVQLLDSVQQKLSVLKRFRCIKRKCRSPLTDSENSKCSRKSFCSTSPQIISQSSIIPEDHQSLEVIVCDSTANSKMKAISSKDQVQEIGSD